MKNYEIQTGRFGKNSLPKIMRSRSVLARNKIEALEKFSNHVGKIAKKLQGHIVIDLEYGARSIKLILPNAKIIEYIVL